MDLKNFEGTTTYAIEAVYREYWNLIPDKYKLMETAQLQEYKNTKHPLNKKDLYKAGEEPDPIIQKNSDTEYTKYVGCLQDDTKRFNLDPFFDPELTFENRLHYKLASIDYPKRSQPWFIITWNFGGGIINSSLTRRRFMTGRATTPQGEPVVFDFMNTELDITMCVTSNTLQALMELQEVIKIGKREKCTVNAKNHSIIDTFPVSLDIIDGVINKISRQTGTLCTLTMVIKLQYPLINNIRINPAGQIQEIHTDAPDWVEPA